MVLAGTEIKIKNVQDAKAEKAEKKATTISHTAEQLWNCSKT